MQRKYLLRAALILVLIAGSYFILWSATRTPAEKKSCTESMEACCTKNDDQCAPGESLIETFSRQFISTSVVAH
jgi:hypothetical protein